jgi:hypothetical protein
MRVIRVFYGYQVFLVSSVPLRSAGLVLPSHLFPRVVKDIRVVSIIRKTRVIVDIRVI